MCSAGNINNSTNPIPMRYKPVHQTVEQKLRNRKIDETIKKIAQRSGNTLITQKHKDAIMEKFKLQIQKGVESEMYNQIMREKSNELFRVVKDGELRPTGAELLKNSKIQKHLNQAILAAGQLSSQEQSALNLDNFLMKENNSPTPMVDQTLTKSPILLNQQSVTALAQSNDSSTIGKKKNLGLNKILHNRAMIRRHEEEARLIILRERENASRQSSLQSTRSIKRNFKTIDEINDYTWNLFKNSQKASSLKRIQPGEEPPQNSESKKQLNQWNQAIKSEQKINQAFQNVGAEATDLDDLMMKIENSKKSASLEIMGFAFEKIKKEEHRTNKKLSQAEKNRIVMQFLKLNHEIKKRSHISQFQTQQQPYQNQQHQHELGPRQFNYSFGYSPQVNPRAASMLIQDYPSQAKMMILNSGSNSTVQLLNNDGQSPYHGHNESPPAALRRTHSDNDKESRETNKRLDHNNHNDEETHLRIPNHEQLLHNNEEQQNQIDEFESGVVKIQVSNIEDELENSDKKLKKTESKRIVRWKKKSPLLPSPKQIRAKEGNPHVKGFKNLIRSIDNERTLNMANISAFQQLEETAQKETANLLGLQMKKLNNGGAIFDSQISLFQVNDPKQQLLPIPHNGGVKFPAIPSGSRNHNFKRPQGNHDDHHLSTNPYNRNQSTLQVPNHGRYESYKQPSSHTALGGYNSLSKPSLFSPTMSKGISNIKLPAGGSGTHEISRSQLLEMRAERSLEKLDQTLKAVDYQKHYFNDIMGVTSVVEQSGKIKELVLRHKARIVQKSRAFDFM